MEQDTQYKRQRIPYNEISKPELGKWEGAEDINHKQISAMNCSVPAS